MSTFVSDFLLNPVIRQARRLSEISRSLGGGDAAAPIVAAHPFAEQDEDVADRCDVLEPRPPSVLPAAAEGTILEEPAPVNSPSPRREGAVTPTGAQSLVPAGKPAGTLPEDDGQAALRRRLQHIQRSGRGAEEKARLMHAVLMEKYLIAQATSRDPASVPAGRAARSSSEPCLAADGPGSLKLWPWTKERYVLTAEDIKPTYSDIDPEPEPGSLPDPCPASRPLRRRGHDGPRPLGCQHYLRNVKLQCSTCSKWHTCRFCHDSAEDHSLIRKDTRNMLCMVCACPQRAAETCVQCGTSAARYYCSVCKLWDDHPDKPIYHCNDCGICRRGVGLGKDFFHCKKCCACISMSTENSHKCIERSTDCDCPICGDYLFTSPKPVVFMVCGHSIHEKCYHEYTRTAYKCPICNRSLYNMETHFRNLDAAIESQPMPDDFVGTCAAILCNDCSARISVPYHWLGLKCAICNSYNTVELQVIGRRGSAGPVGPSEGMTVQAIADVIQHMSLHSATLPGRASVAGRAGPAHGDEDQYHPTVLGRIGDRESMLADAIVRGAVPPIHDSDDSEDDLLGFWAPQTDSEDEHAGDIGDPREGGDDDRDERKDDQEEQEDNGADDDDDGDEEELILIGHR